MPRIFVSYAHVDDEPLLPVATEGWVTTLIRCLENVLARKMGRRDAFSIWMDHRLSGNQPLTPEILGEVRQATAMILVLSPGYLSSIWTRKEMIEFVEVVGEFSSRIFVVERDRADRPRELADLRGYKFWELDSLSDETHTLGDPTPTANDRLYFAGIGDLAADLSRELTKQQPEAVAPAEIKGTIFLAEATDDIDPLRDEVRRFLEQKQIRVIPHETTYPRNSEAAFVEAVDEGLAQCSHFVQLLSGVAGKRPQDGERSFVALQLDRALAARKPIVQWRDPELDLKTVRDPAHAALLEGEHVLAIGLEELKNEIEHRVLTPPPPPPAQLPGLVFVNAEQSDLGFAGELTQMIANLGAGYVLPLQGSDPASVRADLERNLLDCDKLMIVYGSTTAEWVREQLRYARKVLYKRERGLQGLAIYQGPPPPKPPVGFNVVPNQLLIDGSTGPNESGLRAFVCSPASSR